MTVVVDRPAVPVIDTSARATSARSGGAARPTAVSRLAACSPAGADGARPRRADGDRPACADVPEVFLDPALESEPTSSAPARVRRQYATLAAEATEVCASCPLISACLYRAVVDYDVAGFVAGTTARQRAEVRNRLGVEVEPEDFDSLAGVVGGQRTVDHDEVVRLRRTHPDESLERIARRLGCSLSTVKRHLRQERHEPSATRNRLASRPTETRVRRTTAEILAETSGNRRAAA
ncbi:WhiB family transcriptional regulator [Microlunatus aurantiacus]